MVWNLLEKGIDDMKTVCEINKCAGCMACVEVCPKEAISVKDDIIHLNAIIETEKCFECNMCHKVCGQNEQPKFHTPQKWYQGWINDASREKSSSGGFAATLMKSFISNGGTVCTCLFDNGKFGFKFFDTEESIDEVRGSKYVKSNPSGIYKDLKKKLNDEKKLLFIGLPCQVAGAINFVGTKNLANLYTVDLICHGSPSVKVLSSFLKEFSIDLKSINRIDFRNNTSFGLYIDGKKLKPQIVRDKYMIGFLNSLFYTENCYDCKYARKERISDITIGDSWGSNLSESEQKKGISLALCNTEKGRKLIETSELFLTDVDVENAVKNNHQLYEPSKKPDCYDSIMKMLGNGKKVSLCVRKAYPKASFRQDVKELLVKLKIK